MKRPIKLPVSKVTAVIPFVIPIGTKVRLKKELYGMIKGTKVEIRSIYFNWNLVTEETEGYYYEGDDGYSISESDIIPDENIIRTTLEFQIPLVSSYTIHRKESGIEKVNRKYDCIMGFYSRLAYSSHIHFYSSICDLSFNASGDIMLDLSCEKIIELNGEKCNS